MIIPKTDRTLINIYRCAKCGGAFLSQTGNYVISCAVNHAPGDCCHYGETSIADDVLNRVIGLLNA